MVTVKNGTNFRESCIVGRRSSISNVRWDIGVYTQQVLCPATTCTYHNRFLPRDASAERGDATVSCPSVRL